jgi:hypothetical protein
VPTVVRGLLRRKEWKIGVTVINLFLWSNSPIFWVKEVYRKAHGGTVLQAGRLWVQFLMVSLEFFIDKILPAAIWHWH